MAGQIVPRGERTWLVRVFIGRDSDTGKRQYQNKTIHGTKKDAQRYLTESLRDRDMGIVVEPETSSLGRYLDKWLESSAKPRLRTKTLDDYRKLLARYVRPVLGGRPLAKIRPLEIQTLYQGMQERGLSARTVRSWVFARDDYVDVMTAAQAMVHYRQQAVGIRWKVNTYDLGLLIDDVVDETWVLVRESVVILAPDMRGQQVV